MAEAGGETSPPPIPVKYFCYSCNREITTISSSFTCSTCGSGFIEEIQEGAADNPASPPPLMFGGGGGQGGVAVSPGGLALGQFFRSISQPAGQGQGPHAISFDLFDILNGGLQGQQRQGQVQPNSTGATTSGSDPSTPNTSRPRGHFSVVIDSRPRHGGTRSEDGSGTSVTITGGPGGANAGPGGAGGPPTSDNPMENMLYSFLNDLITGLGGPGGGGNVNITGVPVLGNLGDYVWGRDGLDAIVTQLMNQMEGTGPPPMAEEKVKEIPDVSIRQEQVDRKLQCSVCWDDFKVEEKVKQLECEHLFHPDCILPWLKLHGTCPICRRDFTDGEQQDSSQANPGSAANLVDAATGNTGNSSATNPTQGAAPPQNAANSPLAFLNALVNAGPFSMLGNSQNPPQTGGSSQNSRNPNSEDSSRNGGSGGGGGGGHQDLDYMDFEFD